MLGPWSYLALELGWALPVIALQWAVGGRTLLAYRRVLAIGVLGPTVYLSLADALAIGRGIWTLSPDLTLGVSLLGIVPLEEALFFLLTNTMVVQGLLLLRYLDVKQVLSRRSR